MYLLVAYDVNTLTPEGRRRLRRVAKICTGYGQRVQYSVFEIDVTDVQKARLMERLRETMDPVEDSVRIYHLPGDRDRRVETIGRDTYVDFTAPLIL